MNNLVISYDLRKQRNYQQLYDAIASLGNAEKVLESVWYVNSAYSVVQCRDYLRRYIDSDDGLVVFDCTNNAWATSNASTSIMNFWWNN